MEQAKIDRINVLARKAKTQGLSEAEVAERDILRKEYIASVVGSLEGHLDNTYLLDEAGKEEKLKKK